MTNNNQYFERKMLINAQKTNEILESNNWEPIKQLLKLNEFFDSSCSTIQKQDIINTNILSIFENNSAMKNIISEINKKIEYQNNRPPGYEDSNIWFPSELLQKIVILLQEANNLQEETGTGKELSILNDISNNTGAAIPFLENVSNDISKNTLLMENLIADNSKNLINLLGDLSGNNVDSSKNVFILINDNSKNLINLLVDNSLNLINIKEEILTGNSYLSDIDNKISSSNNTLDTNLNNLGTPWLSTINSILNILNSNITTLLGIHQVKIARGTDPLTSENWFKDGANTVAEASWASSAIVYPPKKFFLFVKLDAEPTSHDYINLYGSPTGATPTPGYYLYKRYTYDDFNPPIVEGDVGGNGETTWTKVSTDLNHVWAFSKICDWIGQYMKIEIKHNVAFGSPPNIIECYARGI